MRNGPMPGEAPSRAKQATLLWIPRRGACAAAGPAGPAAVTVARVGPAAGAPALRLTLLRPARLRRDNDRTIHRPGSHESSLAACGMTGNLKSRALQWPGGGPEPAGTRPGPAAPARAGDRALSVSRPGVCRVGFKSSYDSDHDDHRIA